ncbi:hypothetical protein BJ085DRAFT_36379, partial [Dimargaris cristalligena]
MTLEELAVNRPATMPLPAPPTKYPLTNTRLATWAELKDIVEAGQLHLLKRSPPMQQYYDVRKKEVAQTHPSMAHYVVDELLGWSEFLPKSAAPSAPSSASSSSSS